jgi:2-methylcitrate dehydratase PrpD
MTDSREIGLSTALANHVAQAQFSQLSPATVHATKRALLDAIGVMQAASGLCSEVRPFIELACAQRGPAEAVILGTGARAPAAYAALANGAMAHALDFEDAFDAAPVHPDASLVPAVLALAQAHPPVSGRELITAIAVGCDITCRLALSLRQPLEQGGWYPPPILGAFGAVAGAARLLKLHPSQVVDAWSLILLQNSCPGEIKHDGASVIRAIREAFPAQAAVTSVQLAAAGTAGFAAPLEGRAGFFALFAGGRYEPLDLHNDLGRRWHIEQLSFKPWPSCRGTHAAVEAALVLRAANAVAAAGVEEIIIEGGPVQVMLTEPQSVKQAPSTAIDAKFSLPFTIATAWVHGAVNLDSFSQKALADPDVLDLARRVQFQLREDWPRGRAASGNLSIRMRDGRQLRHEVPVALGSPARPLADSQLVAKFIDCLSRADRPVPAGPARALATRILALEDEPDAGNLF